MKRKKPQNKILSFPIQTCLFRMRYAGILLFFIAFTFPTTAQEKVFGVEFTIDTNFVIKTPIALQAIIDNAKEGDTIYLESAIYRGPIHIRKNGIVIDGQGHSEIDGQGQASVVNIEAEYVTLKNTVIANSGGSHDKVDSGVQMIGGHNTVKNCRIKECLFGVNISQSDSNKVIHNEITSLSRREKALKGDAIRLCGQKVILCMVIIGIK